jgi:TctA family transporter
MPTWAEFKRIWPSALRGSLVGSFLGILPGGGPTIAQFAAYAIDKKVSKFKHEIGTGCIEGVAAPESANNAAAQTSFIPLLTLGIPTGALTALMLGAMTIQGIAPGPQVMTQKPDLFWGLIVSMWIGNGMLVILNLPMIGMWIKLLTVPYRWLFPAILMFCCIGVYSTNNSPIDIYITAFFALLGYVMAKLDCEPAPLLLGFVLGPLMEENLRRAMLISRGDWSVFFTRPISASMLAIAGVALLSVIAPFVRRKREEVLVAE